MNKDRRERLADVESTIEEAVDQIQDLIDEEQEAIDNLPDSLQESARAMVMSEAIEDMEDLIDKLCNFEDLLSRTVEKYSNKKQSK